MAIYWLINRQRETTLIEKFAVELSKCSNFDELATLLTLRGFTDQVFEGCLLASVDNDGRIREIGRYGIEGLGPSKEPVALSGEGLVANALRTQEPRLIGDSLTKANHGALTPDSDIDNLVLENDYQSIFLIPLVDNFYSYGVIGLGSKRPLQDQPEFQIDEKVFQSLVSMCMRAISHRTSSRQPSQPDWGHELTAAQKEVLAFLAQDKSNKEIAEYMSLSVSTVKLRVGEILKILEVDTRKEAGIKARYSGLY
jgi:DNA-binding CsgD family transcriptional regulator